LCFDQVAQAVPSSALARGLAEAFRSEQTAPFPQMAAELFARGNSQQQAGVLGANQSYTVKSGDNLSKISNRFYGSPHHYSNIAAAGNIADPNKIQVGEQITVPVLT